MTKNSRYKKTISRPVIIPFLVYEWNRQKERKNLPNNVPIRFLLMSFGFMRAMPYQVSSFIKWRRAHLVLKFRSARKQTCLFLADQSLRLGVFESKRLGRAYAVGGTIGWRLHVRFSKIASS